MTPKPKSQKHNNSNPGRRRIILKRHFITRWGQRINASDAPSKMKSVLHSALINKELIFLRASKHSRCYYYTLEIMRSRAVCVIDATGAYTFITVLSPWMNGARSRVELQEGS